MRFTGKELDDATSGFSISKQIGEGGYGSVYKGKLRQTTVAIKLLSQVCINFVYMYNYTSLLNVIPHVFAPSRKVKMPSPGQWPISTLLANSN